MNNRAVQGKYILYFCVALWLAYSVVDLILLIKSGDPVRSIIAYVVPFAFIAVMFNLIYKGKKVARAIMILYFIATGCLWAFIIPNNSVIYNYSRTNNHLMMDIVRFMLLAHFVIGLIFLFSKRVKVFMSFQRGEASI